MRKCLLTLSMAAALATPTLAAAESPVAGNMTIASDYRFRGISQTYLGPTIQGGLDYAHSGGVYLGNWNSNVSSLVYTGGAGIEMDFYAGYKRSFGDVGFDVGVIYYWYSKAKVAGDDFNNTEVYIGASWKWLSGKIFYALNDYFGLNSTQADNYWAHKDIPNTMLGGRGGSKGTTYVDLAATVPLAKELSLVAHYGILSVEKYSELDYDDWKIGVTYDLAGWVLGAAYVDSNAKAEWWYTAGSVGSKDTGKGTVVLSVMKAF